jgi:penicillin-binding protein 1A
VVTRILTRDGKVVYERNGSGFPQAVTDVDLGAMNRMLRAVVTNGTGTRAAFPGAEVAGKTGTSQDYRDAWFIGYTSELVAGVWVGNDDNSPTKQVTGGLIPAEIWRDVIAPAHVGLVARVLPGIQNKAVAAPTTIARVEKQDARKPDTQDEPRMQNNGFFEDIGSLFRSDQSGDEEKRKKRRKLREERVRRAQEEH